MKVYQIDYDLRKQRDYESLHERIKKYGTYSHALESTWFVVTNETAAQVRDKLQAVIDNDDWLIVTKLQGEAAWVGLRDATKRWLKEHLGKATV